MSNQTPFTVARATGRSGDPTVRELVGEWLATDTVQRQLVDRVTRAIGSGVLPPSAASLLRLLSAEAGERSADLAVQIAGAAVATGVGSDPGVAGRAGVSYLMRQGGSLGGGSTEIARNIVSERMLGMPREHAPDRDVPFSQVKRGRS
jgi:alkylation response protein AidB-like acyl-CoA dehydrogenase